MLSKWVAGLPGWVLAGLALGGVLAALVAAVFAIGARRFPDPDPGVSAGAAGEPRRKGEIREYLRAIDEPFLEDHPVADRTVDFFLTDRDVAITFDAHTYFGLERAGVSAILVEHELPGARLGDRLPFETPDVTADAPGGVETAFAVLGLAPDATTSEVREAYRERIKDVHPDHGGDADTFQRVREAYDVARQRAD